MKSNQDNKNLDYQEGQKLQRFDKKDLMYHPDNIIEKWLLQQQKPQKQLKNHQSGIDSILFNLQNENELFSGGHDHFIKRWDLNKKEVISNLLCHDRGVWCMDQSKLDLNLLVSSGCDKQMIFWDLRVNKNQKPILISDGPVYDIKFNDKADQVALVNDTNNIIIYDLKKKAVFKNITTQSKINYTICFDNNNEFMCTGDFDGCISLYDVKDYNLVCNLKGDYNYENRINCVKLDWNNNSKIKQKILTGSTDGIIRVINFDKQDKKLRINKEFFGATDQINSLSIDSQQSKLISTSREGYSKQWNLANFQFEKSLVGHNDNISCCDISKNNQVIATGSWDQNINIYKQEY